MHCCYWSRSSQTFYSNLTKCLIDCLFDCLKRADITAAGWIPINRSVTWTRIRHPHDIHSFRRLVNKPAWAMTSSNPGTNIAHVCRRTKKWHDGVNPGTMKVQCVTTPGKTGNKVPATTKPTMNAFIATPARYTRAQRRLQQKHGGLSITGSSQRLWGGKTWPDDVIKFQEIPAFRNQHFGVENSLVECHME